MEKVVSLVACDEYEEEKVFEAVKSAVDKIGGIESYVKAGQKVAIKANLLMKATPEKCATTHPFVVAAIGRLCKGVGAEVVIVDSAGGPFTSGYMNSIYKASGLEEIAQKYDLQLNENFDFVSVENPNGVVGKKFDILQTLSDADVIINACKLKTHAFAGFTNAVKNMFGAIPGLTKVEMHGKYRDINTFCDFLFDIHTYFGDKLCLNISDAVWGMEGEGPSNGTPRKIGVIMASSSASALDVVSVKLINADMAVMPTIQRGLERGFLDNLDVDVVGDDLQAFVVKDFQNITPNVLKPYANYVPQCMQKFVHNIMTQRPNINHNHCRGCGKCFEHCPVKAISMVTQKNGRKVAKIDYDKCIRCFCCQELCPFGVIKIKSGLIYKIVHKGAKKRRKTDKIESKTENLSQK